MKNIFYNGDTNNNIIDRVSFVQSLKSGMNAMDVIEALLAFKPSDAVPVVRCKDYICFCNERCNHPQWKDTKYGVYEEDFCSYGESKEEK